MVVDMGELHSKWKGTNERERAKDKAALFLSLAGGSETERKRQPPSSLPYPSWQRCRPPACPWAVPFGFFLQRGRARGSNETEKKSWKRTRETPPLCRHRGTPSPPRRTRRRGARRRRGRRGSRRRRERKRKNLRNKNETVSRGAACRASSRGATFLFFEFFLGSLLFFLASSALVCLPYCFQGSIQMRQFKKLLANKCMRAFISAVYIVTQTMRSFSFLCAL